MAELVDAVSEFGNGLKRVGSSPTGLARSFGNDGGGQSRKLNCPLVFTVPTHN